MNAILNRMSLCLLAVATLSGGWPAEAAQDPVDLIELNIVEPGEVTKAGPEFKVKPNENVSLQLTYTGQNLARTQGRFDANTWLKVSLTWFDADGVDVDVARAAQGFPPLKRFWEVADGSGKPVALAVNASVPGNAVKARVGFALLRDKPLVAAQVEIRGITLNPGQVTETGIPVEITGPADAGPLNAPPTGVTYGANLVPNATLEEGEGLPTGWRVIGDNSEGAAQWVKGGAYSGRHAFRLDDRGPYVRSWGETNVAELGVPGGAPTDNYGMAREEVSARWVSDPVPAEPNALYQTTASVYYRNRHAAGMNSMNPVRIQFLDKEKRVLAMHPWANVLPPLQSCALFSTPGWVPLVGSVVAAPANAAWVRVAVALHIAYFSGLNGFLVKAAVNPGFVMVDNIALYRVSTPQPAGDPAMTIEQAFQDTVAAGHMPFVPTSPAHRPNSLTAESHTPIGAGILEQGEGQALGLVIRDRIGDRRELSVAYDMLDFAGKTIFSGKAQGRVEPFQEAVLALDTPGDLPLGPYTVAYTINEGETRALEGITRFAVTTKPAGDLAEHSRMDYPFATWSWMFGRYLDSDPKRFHLLGKVLRYMGSGKTSVLRPSMTNQLKISDPVVRKEKRDAEIAEARRMIKAINQYDIFVMPMMHELPPATTDEDYPIIRETVAAWVTGLADLTKVWDHSDEPSGPNVDWSLIDETKKKDGSNLHVWGYTNTGRRFIENYKVVYAAAKEAQPDLILGFNTASSDNANVVHNLMKLGAKFDMLGCNMFMNPFAIWTAKVKALKDYGLADKIYLTGQNLGMAGAPNDDLEFARFQTKYWVQMLQAFPMLAYAPEYMERGLDNNFFIQNERVKPAWASYAAMTRMLGAGRFTQKHTFPGAEVYVRERSVRPGLVGVAWATGETPTEVELNVGAPRVTVTDLWGNPRVVECEKEVLTLTVTDSPQYILDATKIEPAPSVRITMAQASADASQPQFSVTLFNEKPIAVGGELLVDPQGAETVAPARMKVDPIPAGESRTYPVNLAIFDPSSDKQLPIKARFVTDENGRAYEAVQPLNFHFAPRRVAPPSVDGFLNDWSVSDRKALVADREDQLFRYQNVGPWSGPAELSGKLWMQWDKHNLYLAARVRDQGQTVAKDAGDLWAGDSIEMLIAPSGGREKDSPYTQIALGLVEGGQAMVMRYQGAGVSGPITNAQVSVRRVDGGYIHEAAIPWAELTGDASFTPKPGHAITAVFGFNDKDAGVRMMSWFNRVTYKDPTRFGQIILTGPVETGVEEKPAPNLVPNGDFDDPALPPADDLTGWRTTFRPDKMGNPSAKAYLSKEEAYEGKSLVIERLHDQNHATAGGFRVPVEAGRRYLIRAMIKAPERQPSLWIAFRDAAGKTVKVDAPAIVLTPATSWVHDQFIMLSIANVYDRDRFHPAAAVVEAPAGAKALTIDFSYNMATGKAWFDDVEVFELATPERPEGKE